MKTKIKSVFLLNLIALLMFAYTAYSQIGDSSPMPAEQFQRYYAAIITDSDFREQRKLYIGKYSFKDIKGKSGFLGIFGNLAGVQVSASNLVLNPGYKAEVCGTFTGTDRYMCLPYFEGENKLKEFSDVDEIVVSKMRVPGEVVLWYGSGFQPIAVRGNDVFDQRYHFPSPSSLWIPSGYWVRLCKSKTPKQGECETYTADKTGLKAPNEYVRVGKGTPPPLLVVTKPQTQSEEERKKTKGKKKALSDSQKSKQK